MIHIRFRVYIRTQSKGLEVYILHGESDHRATGKLNRPGKNKLTVIGACSVVIRDIAETVFAAGNPNRVIKNLTEI
jgi:hypothetical protein